jgi:hypothetical protein
MSDTDLAAMPVTFQEEMIEQLKAGVDVFAAHNAAHDWVNFPASPSVAVNRTPLYAPVYAPQRKGRPAPMPATRKYNSDELAEMVSMRLRSAKSSFFQHWHMHRTDNGEKVIILIVDDNKHVTLEDEWPLFPSDALITKLRLLEK